MGSAADKAEAVIIKQVEKAVSKFMIRGHQALVSSTPVRFGFARAGWTPSTGSPKGGPSDPPKDESIARSQAQSILKKNKNAVKQISSTYRISRGKAFFSNSVKYIIELNAGSSAQAASNFVFRAIAQAAKETERDLASSISF